MHIKHNFIKYSETNVEIGGIHSGGRFKLSHQIPNITYQKSWNNTIVFRIFKAKDCRVVMLKSDWKDSENKWILFNEMVVSHELKYFAINSWELLGGSKK